MSLVLVSGRALLSLLLEGALPPLDLSFQSFDVVVLQGHGLSVSTKHVEHLDLVFRLLM